MTEAQRISNRRYALTEKGREKKRLAQKRYALRHPEKIREMGRKNYERIKLNRPPKPPIRAAKIDNGIEMWHFIMARRGFDLRQERLLAYKQLKKDHEEFKRQGMHVAA